MSSAPHEALGKESCTLLEVTSAALALALSGNAGALVLLRLPSTVYLKLEGLEGVIVQG